MGAHQYISPRNQAYSKTQLVYSPPLATDRLSPYYIDPFSLALRASNSESESDREVTASAHGTFVAPADAGHSVAVINHAACPKQNLVRDMDRVPILYSPGSIKEEFQNTDAYHTQAIVASQELPELDNVNLENDGKAGPIVIDNATFPNSPGSYLIRYIEPKSENKPDVLTSTENPLRRETNITQDRDTDLLLDFFDASDEETIHPDTVDSYKNIQEEDSAKSTHENHPGRTLQRHLTNVLSESHLGHSSHLSLNASPRVAKQILFPIHPTFSGDTDLSKRASGVPLPRAQNLARVESQDPPIINLFPMGPNTTYEPRPPTLVEGAHNLTLPREKKPQAQGTSLGEFKVNSPGALQVNAGLGGTTPLLAKKRLTKKQRGQLEKSGLTQPIDVTKQLEKRKQTTQKNADPDAKKRKLEGKAVLEAAKESRKQAKELAQLNPTKRARSSRRKKKQNDCENAMNLLPRKASGTTHGCGAPFRPVPPRSTPEKSSGDHTFGKMPSTNAQDTTPVPTEEATRITLPLVT